MQIVTLTSDFGHQDHYVASLKGSIYSKISHVVIVDISHSIKAFNSSNAAYQLQSCFNEFPEGTIHIMAVDSEPNLHARIPSKPVVMKFQGHYFIGNNNGFFGSFLGENEPEFILEMPDKEVKDFASNFTSKSCFVMLAEIISKKDNLNKILEPCLHIKKSYTPISLMEGDRLLGHVINIDAFGNIITNISMDDFQRCGKNNPFTIYYANKLYYIDRISNHYNEVIAGEKLALFNSNSLLEIAVNKGVNNVNAGASKLFGMKIGDTVTVEFTPPGSVKDLNSLF